MPFYDYKCDNPECDNIEEVMLSRDDLDKKEILCGKCASTMKRLISNPDFKMAGAPPKNWQPKSANKPKSEVRNIHGIRRIEKN